MHTILSGCFHKHIFLNETSLLSSYHGHEESQERRIKERFKFHFETTNKTKLYDSKTKTKKLKIETQDVQNKCENKSLLC